MKKLIIILALSLLTLTGCKQKIDPKDIYMSEYNSLMQAVDDLSLYDDLIEVTEEYPGPRILFDKYYKNYDFVYYITETEDLEINDESVENINRLIKNYFVKIIPVNDENIIMFQTVLGFEHDEYLIYSKNKIQSSDKTLVLSSWLDDNWYIATYN